MQSDPMGAKIGTAPQSPRGLNQGTKVEEVVKNYVVVGYGQHAL